MHFYLEEKCIFRRRLNLRPVQGGPDRGNDAKSTHLTQTDTSGYCITFSHELGLFKPLGMLNSSLGASQNQLTSRMANYVFINVQYSIPIHLARESPVFLIPISVREATSTAQSTILHIT